MEPIVLASTSPRRQEILKNLAIPFTVMSPSYEEPFFPELSPIETAELHSMKKVESVIRMDLKISAPWVLGADTLICLENRIFGKPGDRDEAANMLASFSGKTHEVITGLSLYDATTQYISTTHSVSKVTFMEMDASTIEKYLDTGEWQGVAGAYRIQGLASCLITRIEGSWSGIVGLPIHELYAILREHGYSFTI